MSSTAAASDDQAKEPLFSDRTDQTDKTITRYTTTTQNLATVHLIC